MRKIDSYSVQVIIGVNVTCHPISDLIPSFLTSVVQDEVNGVNSCSFVKRFGCDQLRVS